MYGTVAAQARNFSWFEALPVIARSGMPFMRIARHLYGSPQTHSSAMSANRRSSATACGSMWQW